MNVSRNKLLLNMAKKGVVKEINDSFELADLTKTMEISNKGHSDDENDLVQLSDIINEDASMLSLDKSLPLFGDDTLKEILEANNNLNGISISTIAEIHQDTTLSESVLQETSVQSAIQRSRSVTPIPLEPIIFRAEENPVDDHNQENNEPPLSPGINSLITDGSAPSSASGASSECSSPSSTVMSGRKRRKFSVDTSKKKRKCRKDTWIDTKRKLLLNRGESHLSRNGKMQKQKDIRSACENCIFKCCTKISEERRQQIFGLFWGLGNHVKQWEFIGKYTKRHSKKRITTNSNSKRNFSVHYFLPISSEDGDTQIVKVCKVMFKNTLSISNQFIQSAMDKFDSTTGTCEIDHRGIHSQVRVLTEEVIKGVCDHVKSFQPVESHYSRKDSNKLYLENSLNFSIMFKMYQTWAQEKSLTATVKTLRQYRDVVNQHMNMAFFVPKKDQCDQCTANKNKPQNHPEDATFAKHLHNKNLARSLKAEDKQQAQSLPSQIGSATFDFQKILNSPHGEVNSFYYKRKLSVFNFTVFDMGLKKAICYMWDETIAKRGSNEVASCLYDYIKRKSQDGIKDIRLWSDNCGGQNRNRIVFAMYMYVAKKFNIRVCHRFLEKGHTQQEGDSVHALIERSSKNKQIFSPQEWYTCVRWSKVNNEPYEVVEISQADVLDFKSTLSQYQWLKNVDMDKVTWNQVREIAVEPDKPDMIFYKYDLDESSMNIDCCKRKQTRSQPNQRIAQEPEKAYNAEIPITTAKYNDLISLCQQNLIPLRYHNFYKELKHGSLQEGDFDCDGE